MINQNYLEKLELDQLTELAKFVVEENFNHHCEDVSVNEIVTDTQEVYDEELNYFKDSEIFVAKDFSGNIQGSIRVIKWDYKTKLPLQKIFDIDPLSFFSYSEKLSSIWHIGRFATKRNINDKTLFKRLMVCAIAPICEQENGVAFAECDSKLLRIMNLLGIKAKVIGSSVNYLGSETIPIAMSYEGLKEFYYNNKYLVTSQYVDKIPHSIFKTSEYQYHTC
ncbi:hypothetical protein ASE21_00510 [Flavobacterium sp. Root901]|uniref:hypothetical protein n=1 Tax=Flavobacterium sp. Root901 TaxID=1736605 RepID=UPI00070EF181|nr:hypothetical protein [Flavobacterium sp. Root901]KRD12428.1 hypothetical protein ASE21_00510 [Flavobacterium sp. Root901]